MALGRLALGLLLTGLAGAARAEEGVAACPDGEPRVSLALVDPPPRLSTDQGVAALHAESGAPRSATRHQLGLTASRVEWRSEIETRWREGPGGICAAPGRITLQLAQTEHQIRIAREIPRGGCLFRAVEAHERRHAAVNQETLRHAAAEMRRAAEGWAARAEGRGPTVDAAVAALQAGLRESIEPALAAMRRAREAAHAAIDTPDEYLRLSRICAEDQAVLRGRLSRPE